MLSARFRSFLLVSLALVLAMGLCLNAGAEEPRKKVTVMVYMCGADLETAGNCGTSTLSDIYASRYNKEEINVIVLAGGTQRWSAGLNTKVLSLVDVGKSERRKIGVVDELPLASMGDPSTLTSFLAYCYEKYPAETYDLVLWDHGGGPIGGVCWDYLFEGDNLKTPEVVQALAASPFADRGLEMVVMHACLMGSAEFALNLSPFAHYLVASEDSSYGLAYNWLNGMESRSSFDTAREVADAAYALNKEAILVSGASETNSYAVIDLTKLPALNEAVDNFFADVTADLDGATFNVLSRHRRDAQPFGAGESGGDSDFDLVDLGDLVAHYRETSPDKADALLQALADAVAYKISANDHCSGLTVYHPYFNKTYLEKRLELYAALGFSEQYTRYVQEFSSYLGGFPMAEWVQLNTSVPEGKKDLRTFFAMPVSEEQALYYGNSSLNVLLQQEDGSYTFTYTNPATSLEEGTVMGEFVHQALYAVSAEGGSALTAELPYTADVSGNYRIPASLVLRNAETGEETLQQGLVCCTYDRDKKALVPGAVLIHDEATGGYTGAYGASWADYSEIRFSVPSRRETRDANGTLLPFDKWELASSSEFSLAIDGAWYFGLLPETLDPAKLYVTFEVCDSQNNLYSSNLLPVVPGDDDIVIRVDYDDNELLTLSGLKISVLNGTPQLSMTVKNLTETEGIVALQNLRINGAEITLASAAEAYGSGANWGLMKDEVQPFALALDPSLLPQGPLTEMKFDLVLKDAATNAEIGTVPVLVTMNLTL